MAEQEVSLPEVEVVWSEADWVAFERDTRRRALAEADPRAAWDSGRPRISKSDAGVHDRLFHRQPVSAPTQA